MIYIRQKFQRRTANLFLFFVSHSIVSSFTVVTRAISYPSARLSEKSTHFGVNDDNKHLYKMNMFEEEVALNDDMVDHSNTPSNDGLVIPSVRTILRFAITATGIYLCSPLLSLIDTSTAGLLAGTGQQAALNPAVSLTEYSSRLISFLYTAATSHIAASKPLSYKEVSKAGMMALYSYRYSSEVDWVP